VEFNTPSEDVEWALKVERSVRSRERALYLECMDNVPMSQRVSNPRKLDAVGRDVRDGCLLTGVFCDCREDQVIDERP